MTRAVRIAILSDIHLRTRYRGRIQSALERTIEEIDRFDPDYVICLGDVIEGETRIRDAAHIEWVRDRLAFDAPTRLLAGNHDVDNLGLDRLSVLFDNSLSGLEWCQEEPLLFLNTATPRLDSARGEISADQFNLIERAMSLEQPVTVFVHHPIHYRDLTDTVWWSESPERAFCGNKRSVNEALNSNAVRCVFNGHLHETDRTRYNGIDHVTINAFSKETPTLPVTGTHAEVELGSTVDIEVKVGRNSVERYTIQ